MSREQPGWWDQGSGEPRTGKGNKFETSGVLSKEWQMSQWVGERVESPQ